MKWSKLFKLSFLRRITLRNIKGFLQGKTREYKAEGLPDHIKEQVIWRISVMDENCLKNRECPCECEVPGKQFEDRECEEMCYPMMMEPHIWETFKEKIGINMERVRNKTRKRLFNYGIDLDIRV